MGGSGLPKRQAFAQNPFTSIVLKKIVFVRLICVQYLKPNGFFLMEFFFIFIITLYFAGKSICGIA